LSKRNDRDMYINPKTKYEKIHNRWIIDVVEVFKERPKPTLYEAIISDRFAELEGVELGDPYEGLRLN